MPRGVRSTPKPNVPIEWEIEGLENRLAVLHRERRRRFAQLSVDAALYLQERGHRPTGEMMETHFSGTCQCKQEVE